MGPGDTVTSRGLQVRGSLERGELPGTGDTQAAVCSRGDLGQTVWTESPAGPLQPRGAGRAGWPEPPRVSPSWCPRVSPVPATDAAGLSSARRPHEGPAPSPLAQETRRAWCLTACGGDWDGAPAGTPPSVLGSILGRELEGSAGRRGQGRTRQATQATPSLNTWLLTLQGPKEPVLPLVPSP